MTVEPFARPSEAERPPLRLLLNDDDTVAAIGRVEFVPGDRQRVIAVPDAAGPAFVAADESIPGDTDRVYYDEGTGEFRAEGVGG